jgi:hypothetical protein
MRKMRRNSNDCYEVHNYWHVFTWRECELNSRMEDFYGTFSESSAEQWK